MKNMIKFLIVFTSAMFALYTLYHVGLIGYLLFAGGRINYMARLPGLLDFTVLTLACILLLDPRPGMRKLDFALFIIGLGANFIFKLFNARVYFDRLDFNSLPDVLNCAVFVFSELAVLILLVYYVLIRYIANPEKKESKKTVVTNILMIASILLFGCCMAMEYVLILKYNYNIEVNMLATLISRAFYYLGFIGMAAYFMLTGKNPQRSELERRGGIPGMGTMGADGKAMPKNPALGEVDKDFVL